MKVVKEQDIKKPNKMMIDDNWVGIFLSFSII